MLRGGLTEEVRTKGVGVTINSDNVTRQQCLDNLNPTIRGGTRRLVDRHVFQEITHQSTFLDRTKVRVINDVVVHSEVSVFRFDILGVGKD